VKEVLSSGMFRQLEMELHSGVFATGTLVDWPIRMDAISPVVTQFGIGLVGCHHPAIVSPTPCTM